jgi:fatty acid desaturase
MSSGPQIGLIALALILPAAALVTRRPAPRRLAKFIALWIVIFAAAALVASLALG